MKNITISYTDEEEAWLTKHPEINRSDLFRRLIEYMMKNNITVFNEVDVENVVKTPMKE